MDNYIRCLVGSKEDFERYVSNKIKEWEAVKETQPLREEEYNSVI